MGTSLRVLLVEDSKADAGLILWELEDSGYDPQYKRVYTPEDFEAALAEQTWDIVIADYFMPRFDGLKALEMMKESNLELPFVIVSGVIGEDLAVDAMKSGAYDYVMKDRLTRLGPAIQRALQEVEEHRARKRAEEAQQQSEKTARAILNASTDSIFLLDLDGNILAANEIGAQRFGKEVDEIIGLCSYDLMEPDVAAKRKAHFEDVIRTGKPMRLEDEHRGVYFDSTIYPISNEQGEVTRLAIFARDTTDRKRMEETLRKRNRELALINQVSQALSSTLNPDKVLTVAMKEVCSILDVIAASIWLVDPKTDELVCQHAIGPKNSEVRGWRLPPGEGLAGWVAHHGQSLIVPDAQVDEHHCKEVDQRTGLDLRSIISAPLKIEQNVIGVLQVVDTEVGRFSERDLRLLEPLAASAAIAFENARLYEHAQQEIAERKRAEKALRESEAQLWDLYENAPSAYFSVGADGLIRRCNKRAIELLGYPREEMVGKPVFELYTDTPQGKDKASRIFERFVDGVQISDEELQMQKADGAPLWVSLTVNAIRDADGRIVESRSMLVDITKRKQAEKALRQYAIELEARNEELDAFAHTVAHDLKSPLGLILGYSEMLEQERDTMSGETLGDLLRTTKRTALTMSNIIDELLLLSELRHREVQTRPLDMADIVAEAQRRLMGMIEKHRAEIVLPESWPAALGYGPWVEEVWANYLSNAIKYGGQPPHVELGATSQPDGTVRFWVRDNGPGLTPKEQARLFTPFTRLDQARAKGHGLGLSIVRRIVEKLNGQVEVESEVGKGCLFTFILPSAETSEA